MTFTPPRDRWSTSTRFTPSTPATPPALLAELRANPDVEAADFEFTYGLPEDALDANDEALPARDDVTLHKDFPNDPRFKDKWHLQQIHMMDTWKAAQGDGVIVAVIDTGVAKVPDLEETELVPGWNFVTDTPNAADDHGHGTHVAGTIAQSTQQRRRRRRRRVPRQDHADQGALGARLGLGGRHRRRHPLGGRSRRQGHQHVARRADGLVGAREGGQVRPRQGRRRRLRRRQRRPRQGQLSGGVPGRIAVAATQYDETTTFYSNWGKEIDIAAPGGNTRVDQNGDGQPDGVLQNTIVPGNISQNDYLWFMGTSMASPHVAGVAALVIGQGVTNPDAVEKVLKETARKPKAGIKDNQNRYGAGIVDAAAAVKKAQLGYGGLELGAALGFFGLMLLRCVASGARRSASVAAGLAAMVVGASGLFFLPQLVHVPAAAILAHGFPAWEPATFGSLGAWAFHSALAPIAPCSCSTARRAAAASRPASRSASARTWRSSPSPAPSPSRRCGSP